MGEPTIETLARRQERDEREIEGKRSGEGERRVSYQRKKSKKGTPYVGALLLFLV